MKRYVIFLLLFCGASIFGCDGGPPPLPAEPDPDHPTNLNAELPEYQAIYTGASDIASLPHHDTLVVARFRSRTEYATTRKNMNYNYHWYLITYDVAKVEKGNWLFKTIRFIVKYSSPTPESGIRLKVAPFPYSKRVGAVLAFALDTSTKPAKIVGQQRRPE